MLQSVVARVDGGHNDSNHLALCTAQRPPPSHEFHIEIVMMPHHSTVDTVNQNDVVAVWHAVLDWDRVVGMNWYKRHVYPGYLLGRTSHIAVRQLMILYLRLRRESSPKH